jgi:Phosphotriesterase family
VVVVISSVHVATALRADGRGACNAVASPQPREGRQLRNRAYAGSGGQVDDRRRCRGLARGIEHAQAREAVRGVDRRRRVVAQPGDDGGVEVLVGPAADDLARRSVDDVAAQLIGEIEGGFGDTGVRPGIIGEIGASQGWVSPLEERVHRAAARAQIATGLPLATHTLYHSTGAAQMALFDEEGVDPARVCVGHCDTFPSLDYCLTVARWGGYVSIDNVGHQAGDHEADVRRLVLGLIDAGVADHVLLSQDVGQAQELRSRGGRGYTYLIENFLPALRDAGVGEETIELMTVENPRRWLTIAP